MGIFAVILVAAVSILFFLKWPAKGLLFILFMLPLSFALNPLPGFDVQFLRIAVPVWWLSVLLRYPRLFVGMLFTPLSLHSGIFLAVVTASVFFADEPYWSLRKLVYLWSLIPFLPAAAVVLQKKMVLHRTLFKPILISATIVSVLGIAQFFAQFIFGTEGLYRIFVWLAPYLHGNDFGALIARYPSWFVNISGIDYLRAFALFPDPHILAFYLVGTLSLALALIVGAEGKKEFVLFATAYVLMAVCLLLTFSRGGYLGFLTSAGCGIWFFRDHISQRVRSMLTLMLGFAIVLLILNAPIIGRFISSFDSAEGSNVGRIEIWRDALARSEKRPLGVGLGNYAAVPDGSVGLRNPITAHNTYLDIMVETGVLGLIAFAGFFIVLLYGVLTARRPDNPSSPYFVSGAIFGAVMGYAVHAFFENPLFAPAICILVLFYAALVSNLHKFGPEPGREKNPRVTGK